MMEWSTSNELRPHFVKGVEAVFIFRCYQLQRFYRGSQDLQRWIGRLQVLGKRIVDAWMDTLRAMSSEWLCMQKTPNCRPVALPCSSKLCKQVLNLHQLFFSLWKKDLKDGTTKSEEHIENNFR